MAKKHKQSNLTEKKQNNSSFLSKSQVDPFQQVKKTFKEDIFINSFNVQIDFNNSVAKGHYKVLNKQIQVRKVDIQWFYQNINHLLILRQQSHPNIVQILDFYEDPHNKDCILIAEDIPQGKPLIDQIKKKELLTEMNIKNIVKSILQAFSFVHSLDIPHCAFNLQQIFVEFNAKMFQVQICGFYFNFNHQNYDQKTTRRFETYFQSPENIKRSLLSNQNLTKSDLWALGVVIYFLTMGEFPFDGTAEHKLQKDIIRGIITYDKEKWRALPHDALELTESLLTYDFTKRISASNALKSPWFMKESLAEKRFLQSNKKSQVNMINKISSIQLQNKLQEASISLMVSLLNYSEEKKQLSELFNELDFNHDGKVSLQELEMGIDALQVGCDKEEIKKIFQQMDLNQDGEFSYQEFIVAFLDKFQIMKQQNLMQVFKFYDQDGSGKLSYSEIKNVLQSLNVDDEEIRKIITQTDTDRDGEISFKEFQNLMQGCINRPHKILNSQPHCHSKNKSTPPQIYL